MFLAPIVLILIARPTPRLFWIGLPFVIAGELIRMWAAGYLSKLRTLVTAGPFALCRNPLYVGSFLISIGYFFMCNRLDAWIAGVMLFWLFHGGAVVYEERLLREGFGDRYAEYCNTVPRFFPRPARPRGHGNFTIRQFILNNEYRGTAAAIVLSTLFGLMAYHPAFSPFDWLSRTLGR